MTESLVTLLCTAYAAEHESLHVIKEYLTAADDRAVQIRIKEHLVETQWQIKLLRACMQFQSIDKDDPDTEFRDISSQINNTDLLAIKRFEIALYKKIIVKARKRQSPEVLQACREILGQEIAMAEWIEDNHSKTNRSLSAKRIILSAA